MQDELNRVDRKLYADVERSSKTDCAARNSCAYLLPCERNLQRQRLPTGAQSRDLSWPVGWPWPFERIEWSELMRRRPHLSKDWQAEAGNPPLSGTRPHQRVAWKLEAGPRGSSCAYFGDTCTRLTSPVSLSPRRRCRRPWWTYVGPARRLKWTRCAKLLIARALGRTALVI